MQLELDPRWRRLQDRSHVCRCCGVAHGGLFDLSVGQPDYWLDRDGDDRSMLTDDVCVVDGEHCFVRCVAPLPIIGGGGLTFGFGVWSTLSRANFETYVQTADDGRRQGGLGSWFGWFSNQLKGYPDTTGVKCRVQPRDGGLRPVIELEPTDHPLSIEQRQGVTLDRILDLYALNGHDLRPGLLD